MLYGTLFGDVHSDFDLRLIPQSIAVSPAAPKTNLVSIPGGNGSVDLTEALGVGVSYKDRTIKWTFTLYPRTDWPSKRSEVSNALNGKRMKIVLGDDPEWYYDGRVCVTNHKSSKLYHQISVSATCAPYKRRRMESRVDAELSDEFRYLMCNIGQMPLVPLITVGQETTIVYGESSFTVSAGTHTIPALLMSGTQTIRAKVAEGTGTISITWREGSL